MSIGRVSQSSFKVPRSNLERLLPLMLVPPPHVLPLYRPKSTKVHRTLLPAQCSTSEQKRQFSYPSVAMTALQFLSTNERHSTVTLELPNNPQAYPVFHTSEVQPFHENDNALFLDRALKPPDPVIIDGEREFSIYKTVYERRHGKAQYRVRWQGEGPKGDIWLPGVLDIWQAQKPKI